MDISFNNKLVSNLLSYNMYIISKGKSKVWVFGQTELSSQLTQEGGILHFVRYPPGSCNPLLVKSQRLSFLRKSIFSVLGGPKKLF